MKNIPSYFSKETNKTKGKKFNPKFLKQTAKENIRLDNKVLKKELAEKKIKFYCFTHKVLKTGLRINIDSHHNCHIYSKSTINPSYLEIEKN